MNNREGKNRKKSMKEQGKENKIKEN